MLASRVLYPPGRRLVVLAMLLFVTGGCALVYQTAWMRQLTLVFGATTGANAAVLAIFMGGLGAGAALLGKRVDAHPRPLVFYGALEVVIAVSVPLTPFLVDLVRALYVASGGTQTLGAATTPLRLLFAALVLAIPTLAMGGTLPAATRAAALPDDERGVTLAVLYAANAIGAVAGTLIATFFAFEAFGIRATLWIACAVNAMVAALAIYLGREATPAPQAASRPAVTRGKKKGKRAPAKAQDAKETSSVDAAAKPSAQPAKKKARTSSPNAKADAAKKETLAEAAKTSSAKADAAREMLSAEAARTSSAKADAAREMLSAEAAKTSSAKADAKKETANADAAKEADAAEASDAGEVVVDEVPREAPAAPTTWVYGAAFASGFAFFLMELVWYRMLSPLLGGSTFTFGLILAAALLGIGLGALVYRWPGTQRRPTVLGFAAVCGAEAVLMLVPLAIGDDLAIFSISLREWSSLGFGALVGSWAVIVAIVVFPAAFVAGIQFPLLVGLAARGDRIGTRVGRVYAVNTAGAIVGALAGGFGLMSLLGAVAAWRVAALALVATGLGALALHALRTGTSRRVLAAAAPALLAVVLALSDGPSAVWRHSPIGAGRAQAALGSPQNVRKFRNFQRRQVVWERDGVESSIALVVDGAYSFLVNGKSDGNAVYDAGTQVMLGLLGPLFHPSPKSALVVGLGTGSTAGWLAGVPSVERVDVVEIEPAVLDVAAACGPVNRNVMQDPKVRVRIGDAREIVQASSDSYDVIVSEPSNPFRAGVAALFSREFYASVRSRLAPGGILVQWLQTYEVDARTIASVYATLHAELPHIHTWNTGGGDILLLASATPIPLSLAELRARLATPAYAIPMQRLWHAEDLEGVFARFVGDDRLAAALAAGAPHNTDDRPLVEYGFARTAGAKDLFSPTELFEVTKATRAIPQELAALDWRRLLAIRRRDGIENAELPQEGGAPDPLAPLVAVAEAWNKNELKAATAKYAVQTFEPSDRFEQLIVATLEASAGDLQGLGRIDAIQATYPTEAAALRAVLAAKLGDHGNAVRHVVAAARLLRDDPWVPAPVMGQLLATAIAIGKVDRALGRTAFDALAEPWAVRIHESERQSARLTISEQIDVPGTCVAALDPVEPYPPWGEHLLEYRVRCYTETRHPRLRAAEADLAEYRRLAPPRLRDLAK